VLQRDRVIVLWVPADEDNDTIILKIRLAPSRTDLFMKPAELCCFYESIIAYRSFEQIRIDCRWHRGFHNEAAS